MNIILLVLIIYLVLMLGLAFYFSRKESLNIYFLNNKQTGLWLLTFSNAATIIAAGSTVGVVSEVYNSGISIGIIMPISFISGMIIFGIVAEKIKKVGDKYNAKSMVDFFEKRFDKKNKTLVTILQILTLIIWIAVQVIAIASLASAAIGINYTLAILVAAAIVIVYTSIGGLKVDIITDFVQFWIILIVFIIMAVGCYINIGSISIL